MKREYAVYAERSNVAGICDNDLMDWFTDHQEAKEFAIEKATEDDEVVYLSEVENGDFSDERETYSPPAELNERKEESL